MSKCTYCGHEWPGAGYKGECPKCPPDAMDKYYNKCKKCSKGQMKKGIAMMQTWTAGLPDFIGDEPGGPGCTMSPGGPGKIVEVMKCDECGYSVTDGQPLGETEQLLGTTEQLARADAAKKEILRRGAEFEELKDLVRSMFEMFDWEEENQNGNPFHPTYIQSCRVQHTMKLGEILPRMQEICGSFGPLTKEQKAEIDKRISDIAGWTKEGTLDQHCVSHEEVMDKILKKYGKEKKDTSSSDIGAEKVEKEIAEEIEAAYGIPRHEQRAKEKTDE